MFPTIFALGLKGLGRNTKIGGSLLVMAIVGGAIFPPVLGLIARQTGSLALGYVVPLVGFVGVALFGFYQRTQRTLAFGDADDVDWGDKLERTDRGNGRGGGSSPRGSRMKPDCVGRGDVFWGLRARGVQGGDAVGVAVRRESADERCREAHADGEGEG